MKHPIDHIVWRECETLTANHYNPNYVMDPELKLLERSLLDNGWVHPLIVQAEELWIVDGFHRWRLASESARMRERFGTRVPVVELELSMPEAMMMTVRINRAKGNHSVTRMSGLIRALVDEHDLDPQEVARGIGATRKEIDLLYQDNLMRDRKISEYRYSKAWVPYERRD